MVRHEGFHINPQPQPDVGAASNGSHINPQQQPQQPEDGTSHMAEAAAVPPTDVAAAPVYTDWVAGWGGAGEVVGEQAAAMLPLTAAVQLGEGDGGSRATGSLSTPPKVRVRKAGNK